MKLLFVMVVVPMIFAVMAVITLKVYDHVRNTMYDKAARKVINKRRQDLRNN